MSMKGSCNCGKVTVTIDEMPDSTLICHCYNCRKSSGGIFSLNLLVPKGKVHIDGELKEYLDANTASGNIVTRSFCAFCGSPVRTDSPSRPNAVIIKAGLFEKLPAPSMEIFFNKNALPWEKLHDGAEKA